MKRLTQSELIKKEIDRLHKKGSGDWQTLTRQVSKSYTPITLNIAQIMAALAADRCKELYLEGGRGSGKSTLISERIKRCVKEMPRSSGNLIGQTYKQILTRTLPATIQGLEMLGLFKDLHYFVGQKPPRSWKWLQAYQPPLKHDHYIQFWNGSGLHLISHDVPGDGRGLNTDYEIGDESALLSKEKLDTNTTPTLRGSNMRQFDKSKLWLSTLHCSTTPIFQSGFWFVEMEEAAVRYPDLIKFLKFTCEVNQSNLPKDYLEKAQKKLIPWVFEAEYLNVRPRQIKGGFYTLLDEDKHTYSKFNYSYYQNIGQAIDCRGDADLVKGMPLTLGVDWGAAINCLVVCQHVQRELRVLKSMYVLGDLKKVQSDLFDKFIDYYRYHGPKVVYLWYDSTGNVRDGINKRTRAQLVFDQLRKAGWTVHLMTMSRKNTDHASKFLLWEQVLKEDDPRYPLYRVNKSNAKELWISQFNAKAKQGREGKIQKDKSSERSSRILRQHATDLSDAIDVVMDGMFSRLLNSYGSMLPDSRIISN